MLDCNCEVCVPKESNLSLISTALLYGVLYSIVMFLLTGVFTFSMFSYFGVSQDIGLEAVKALMNFVVVIKWLWIIAIILKIIVLVRMISRKSRIKAIEKREERELEFFNKMESIIKSNLKKEKGGNK